MVVSSSVFRIFELVTFCFNVELLVKTLVRGPAWLCTLYLGHLFFSLFDCPLAVGAGCLYRAQCDVPHVAAVSTLIICSCLCFSFHLPLRLLVEGPVRCPACSFRSLLWSSVLFFVLPLFYRWGCLYKAPWDVPRVTAVSTLIVCSFLCCIFH